MLQCEINDFFVVRSNKLTAQSGIVSYLALFAVFSAIPRHRPSNTITRYSYFHSNIRLK